MTSAYRQSERRLLVGWFRASSLGWLLGLAILVALAALWDLFGGGAQFMVGVGMGLGVGYLQSRVLMRWMPHSRRWWVASTCGMGTPLVLHDLFKLAGVPVPFSLPLYVIVGGLLAGILQEGLLRNLSTRSRWWIPGSTLGWALPALVVALGDAHDLSPWREVIGLAGMFGGGVMLGIVSGVVMVWILRAAAIESQPSESPGQVSGEDPGSRLPTPRSHS